MDFELHPIRDDRGQIIFLHPSGVDITELKRVEDELRKSSEELERKVAERTQESALNLAKSNRKLRSESRPRSTSENSQPRCCVCKMKSVAASRAICTTARARVCPPLKTVPRDATEFGADALRGFQRQFE